MFDPDAPDFKEIKTWFNSKPVSIRDLHGKVVLIDFWTYSCVNCLRTLPRVKMLHEKYKDRGLEVIGIHTPEFEFEKDDENIRKALEKHGINYPVANDWKNVTWKLYGNRFWPRRTLVNVRGKIKLEQVGEEGEHELEMKIIELLHEAGAKGEFVVEKDRPRTYDDKMNAFAAAKRRTPETYFGWERAEKFGNSAVCVPGSCIHFVDGGNREDNVVYLNGDWTQEKERIHKEGDEDGYVAMKYTASSVNAVMSPFIGKRHRVYVFLDGKPIERSVAGRDVKIDKTGSYVHVDRPDMYELVDTGGLEAHEIRLQSDSDEFTLYTFTFG